MRGVKTGKTKPCSKCGREFYKRPSKKGLFCSRNCYRESLIGQTFSWSEEAKQKHRGPKSHNWRGERIQMQGYWWVWNPDHPKSNNGRVRECVVVAEKILGRQLQKPELVHHINGDKLDDRPENLYIFPTKKEHSSYHFTFPVIPLESNLVGH